MNDSEKIDSRRSKNNDGQKQQPSLLTLIVGAVTVGGLIGTYLTTSANGVFNFFSDDPALQMYPFFFGVCIWIWYLAFRSAFHFKNAPWLFMVATAICCSLGVLVTKAVDRKVARLTAKPHFIFSLRTSSTFDNALQLTNDAFSVPPNGEDFVLLGNVFIPYPEEGRGLLLHLHILNDSSTDSKTTEVKVSMPKAWECEPEQSWVRQSSNALEITPLFVGGVKQSIPMDILAVRVPITLLPDDGGDLPGILIKRMMPIPLGIISISWRNENSPAQEIRFVVHFVATSTTNSSLPNFAVPRASIGNLGSNGWVAVPLPFSIPSK